MDPFVLLTPKTLQLLRPMKSLWYERVKKNIGIVVQESLSF